MPGSDQPPSRVLDRQRGWHKILWTQHHVLTGKPKALVKGPHSRWAEQTWSLLAWVRGQLPCCPLLLE